MKIKDKINMTYDDFVKYGPINIVAFGDSITCCCSDGEVNYDNAYWSVLRRKISHKRRGIPVNVINAGIGATTATSSLQRLKEQVLIHKPDLIIVCFGLNDVNGTLEDYCTSLEVIFEECKKTEAEVIFMTPNMLNTYVADDTDGKLVNYAKKTAEFQNSGRMDLYMDNACRVARKCNIKICDCYSMWKELSKTQDTTLLLENRINHPSKEMHMLFAEMLFEVLFDDDQAINEEKIRSMYSEV